jgi:hypothetical protein
MAPRPRARMTACNRSPHARLTMSCCLTDRHRLLGHDDVTYLPRLGLCLQSLHKRPHGAQFVIGGDPEPVLTRDVEDMALAKTPCQLTAIIARPLTKVIPTEHHQLLDQSTTGVVLCQWSHAGTPCADSKLLGRLLRASAPVPRRGKVFSCSNIMIIHISAEMSMPIK